MVTRVYMKKGNETTLNNFRKEENAKKFFSELEQTCGAGTRLKDFGLNYNLSTGVSNQFREWENGDKLELISYHWREYK